jgi:WD40 repeat protein
VVWDISTRQIVFQHGPSMGSDVPVAWQPQSHNLTFGSHTPSGDNFVPTLETWNVMTGNLVKQYVGAATGGLAWSPDGTYLAYAGSKDDIYAGSKDTLHAVIIIDAVTSKQVYAYGEHHQSVRAIAWSPNSKYIVSGESNGWDQGVAKVWIA